MRKTKSFLHRQLNKIYIYVNDIVKLAWVSMYEFVLKTSLCGDQILQEEIERIELEKNRSPRESNDGISQITESPSDKTPVLYSYSCPDHAIGRTGILDLQSPISGSTVRSQSKSPLQLATPEQHDQVMSMW